MSGYVVHWCRPQDAYGLWKRVKGLLEPAIAESNGRWQPEYVFSSIVAGIQTLWIVSNGQEIAAAFTTEICNYPERRMICVHYLGGEGFDAWYPEMLKAVTEVGREMGCDGIECNARFGFWKWFKEDGFLKKSCFYEKKI